MATIDGAAPGAVTVDADAPETATLDNVSIRCGVLGNGPKMAREVVTNEALAMRRKKEMTTRYLRRHAYRGEYLTHNLARMARTKNTVSPEETRAEQLKGVRGGRRAQTNSYRKSKELGRGKGANEVGDLPNEASASPASEVAGKELAIRTSQVNAAQRPKTDSTKESKEEATQQGEQERSNQSSYESCEEEGKQVSGEEARRKKAGCCKGWQQGEAGNPKGKKPTNDTSTPFPGGPKNQTLLKSFNNHVTAAIWNGEQVRRAVEVVTAWKALPPGVGDAASALKMADEVLKHLIVVDSSVTSGSTTSAATPSQPPTSKRKATAAEMGVGPSRSQAKKSRT
ncbi:hypothetical protein Scep_021711 [Stephania cephalantha]|uniref:Uncharacterized protein n=1 Tax=Stephania cephalantha TaxID=152367 RepID=A0AAP0F9G5_9MAGN